MRVDTPENCYRLHTTVRIRIASHFILPQLEHKRADSQLHRNTLRPQEMLSCWVFCVCVILNSLCSQMSAQCSSQLSAWSEHRMSSAAHLEDKTLTFILAG